MGMKDIKEIKDILKRHKDYLKEKYHVKSIAIFGSYAKGKQTPESDVDILVEFERRKNFYKLYEFKILFGRVVKSKS
jgi:hypothetical protein